ncbi:plasmid partitioning protein RepB [Oceaniglobus roseus]|uniref:plasmid partitioning protein RepB n=1 Tax=Oceaniglobus roseus TaxID=1737570 RepID=UPI000C7F09BD|nr:plasmid partitioning protein RepB [Kandeliimicrobium roseum]
MVRRNIFQPPPPPTGESGSSAPESAPRFPNTGAMSGVKSTLRDLSTNAVREVDPELIEEDGPRDRLAFGDADVAELAESIRRHGQQVPLMVRPLPGQSGRYRIVYGRRRLRALRQLGIPAKVLIRSLSDEQAILAQGQENAQRLDPSFIEKALFAAELAGTGYETAVILDALAIDRPMLSRMTKVAREIPASVVRAIGPAHGIGRRRWEDLADRVRDPAGFEARVQAAAEALAPLSSDARFAKVVELAEGAQKPGRQAASPALSVAAADGTRIAELRSSAQALTIKVRKSTSPDFAAWLHRNAETELARLYEAWKADQPDR